MAEPLSLSFLIFVMFYIIRIKYIYFTHKYLQILLLRWWLIVCVECPLTTYYVYASTDWMSSVDCDWLHIDWLQCWLPRVNCMCADRQHVDWQYFLMSADNMSTACRLTTCRLPMCRLTSCWLAVCRPLTRDYLGSSAAPCPAGSPWPAGRPRTSRSCSPAAWRPSRVCRGAESSLRSASARCPATPCRETFPRRGARARWTPAPRSTAAWWSRGPWSGRRSRSAPCRSPARRRDDRRARPRSVAASPPTGSRTPAGWWRRLLASCVRCRRRSHVQPARQRL